jgi:hypothetical protein
VGLCRIRNKLQITVAPFAPFRFSLDEGEGSEEEEEVEEAVDDEGGLFVGIRSRSR